MQFLTGAIRIAASVKQWEQNGELHPAGEGAGEGIAKNDPQQALRAVEIFKLDSA